MNVRSLNVMLLTVGAVEVQYEMKKDSHISQRFLKLALMCGSSSTDIVNLMG